MASPMDPQVASVEEVLEQRPKKSTYRTVIANPYLFGVALVSRASTPCHSLCAIQQEAYAANHSSRHLEGSFLVMVGSRRAYPFHLAVPFLEPVGTSKTSDQSSISNFLYS